MIRRSHELSILRSLLRQFPVVAIIGARQVGKTTLAQQLVKEFAGPVTVFDMEDPAAAACLIDPMLALRDLKELWSSTKFRESRSSFPCFAFWRTGDRGG